MSAQKKLTRKIRGEGDESSTDLATSGKGGVADVPLAWQQEDKKSPLVAGSGKCWSQDCVAHWWLTFKWIEIVKKGKVFSFYCMNLQNIIHSHHIMNFHFFNLNLMMETHDICWHYKNCEWLLHTLRPGPSLAGRPFEEQAHRVLILWCIFIMWWKIIIWWKILIWWKVIIW